jgi:lipopolysaccharide transport system ATP-binding protein
MTGNIIVENLGKQFRRYHTHRPSTIQEALIRGFGMLLPRRTIWALRGISFSVSSGQAVGLIGKNGSGKSTLLKMVAGVMKPNEGTGRVEGRISSILDLGAGFHPDLTGRENVIVSGIVGGMTRREVEFHLDSIQAFSEIGSAIDNPCHTYSQGMSMRLMFSLAFHLAPDVILIDEILSVGDAGFKQKCMGRITEFRERGCAILLASHNLDFVREFCDEAIWLDNAGIRASGDPNQVVDKYLENMNIVKPAAGF